MQVWLLIDTSDYRTDSVLLLQHWRQAYFPRAVILELAVQIMGEILGFILDHNIHMRRILPGWKRIPSTEKIQILPPS